MQPQRVLIDQVMGQQCGTSQELPMTSTGPPGSCFSLAT
jgi:hypothetical protein